MSEQQVPVLERCGWVVGVAGVVGGLWRAGADGVGDRWNGVTAANRVSHMPFPSHAADAEDSATGRP